MNNLIQPIEGSAETRTKLAQARADLDSGRISRAEYQRIWDECYTDYLRQLTERQAEIGYLAVAR